MNSKFKFRIFMTQVDSNKGFSCAEKRYHSNTCLKYSYNTVLYFSYNTILYT